MADGFTVTETIAAPPAEVWDFLTNFRHAQDWMTGIDDMTQTTPGPLEVGTHLEFRARGKMRQSRVTALDRGERIALTSTQGGVTATYTYSLVPVGAGTETTLHAVCEATGLWKLLHPVIVIAMKKSDSSHLAKLKAAMARHG
ncbi:MAG: hypothetical protein GY791_02215 [Alphaproteobacteria bacterium]|nr:hypothetical protein [Alphaproteobacteria bacterium]